MEYKTLYMDRTLYECESYNCITFLYPFPIYLVKLEN